MSTRAAPLGARAELPRARAILPFRALPMPARAVVGIGAAALLLASCAVGPDYVKPTAEIPASYRETSRDWKPANPQDQAPRGPWWEMFGDPVLNRMVEEVSISNQNV